jgi:pimeloyl-ACP methyl ester carboxylesterase
MISQLASRANSDDAFVRSGRFISTTFFWRSVRRHGRQQRALMNGFQITANHHVIACDMPGHGKSSPPAGWRNEEHQLMSSDDTRMILEVIRALDFDKANVRASGRIEQLRQATGTSVPVVCLRNT